MISVPLTKKTNQAIAVTVQPNPQMGAWDMAVIVGNFKSEAEARDAGIKLAKMMERELGLKGSIVQ